MGRTIEEIEVRDVEKRKTPSKHYVYVIYVTWSDGSINIIYRRYSRFFDLQSKLMEMFPEEAGSLDPTKRIIPFLPGKKFFGRSHIREVAVKRLAPIADYCKQIVNLPRKISHCKEVMEFFEMDMDDMNPQKGKKASIKAQKISTPKPLEVYIACTKYKKQEKGEVTLEVGTMVEVVEKTETGWWFVNADEEQGWVPSTCLQREDGEREETTIRFNPGQEEQYLCTEDFKGAGPDELSMDRGAVVDVIEKNLEGWWLVRYSGREGYAPATYLMKTEGFQVKKRPEQCRSSTEGPQIIRSLHEVSNLLGDPQLQTNSFSIDDDEFDDTYNEPEEQEEIYSIHEIGRILRENKKNKETELINENIRNMKSASLKRGGSTRPPPRPDNKPMVGGSSPAALKPVVARMNSHCVDYVTIADFSDGVGDGISFSAGQHVKVLEKSEGGWWYVQIEDREGWAPATYIEKVETSAAPSPAPPPPPPQTQKPKPTTGSQEDLSEDDESPRRISAVEGLKGALKAKLNIGRGPPTPPKKDFLDEDDNTIESTHTNEHTQSGSVADFKPGNPGFQLPGKPGGQKKSPGRSLLKCPPPPPQAAKPSSSESSVDTSSNTRPAPPPKVKPELVNKPVLPAKVLNKSEQEEETGGKLNVAGLAGALKAKFEAKDTDKSFPFSPAGNSKPTVDQKPAPPFLVQKPKPTPPSLTQKPKLETKPTPPSLTQKPKLDEDTKPNLKPVLNKVEFPGANKPSHNFPGKPLKPAVEKTTKPSWLKNDNENTNKPPWAKQDDDSDSKPAWAKKPANQDNEITPKAPWAKPKADSSTKPSWVKSENDTSTKPAWAKPKPDTTAKPSWAKKESDSKSDIPCVDVGSTKVSDLASVLKSKFENRNNDGDDSGPSVIASAHRKPEPPAMPSAVNKPVSALKPKPARPVTPPSPKTNKKGLDPTKYASRPLPPKPPGGANEEEEETPAKTKPLPGLPMKPSGEGRKSAGVNYRKDSSSSEDEGKTMGVSGLANALKAKLGANKQSAGISLDSHRDKPLPPVPGISKADTSVSSVPDIQNNNAVSSENLLNAIAAFDASNDGEMSLVIGQQYELLDKAEGWWYVSSGPHEGWAPADYLEYTRDSNQTSSRKSAPNVEKPKKSVFRTCSDFTAENEGELSVPRGQEVNVLDKPEGGWWFVEFEGNEGWLPESYMEEIMV